MKTEIILTIVWASLCLCQQRQQRSTVLTDESKRVLEQFDFSNFDKQEALNYIDRQRYENQIRGKRSRTNFKTDDRDDEDGEISEIEEDSKESPLNEENKEINEETLNSEEKAQSYIKNQDEYNEFVSETKSKQKGIGRPVRSKNGRRLKRKRKNKVSETEQGDELTQDIEEEIKADRKKKKKKKKRKRRKPYWDKWTEWSPCSVTCGRGRKIRWRKCIAKNCKTGEIEMGEKTCQLPACNLLTKLLGL